MSTKRIWVNENGDYLGAIGVDSIRGLAVLAHADKDYDIADALGIEADTPTIEDFEEAINGLGVQPLILSVAEFSKEIWDGSRTYPCDIADRPGSGRVKVLGVHL